MTTQAKPKTELRSGVLYRGIILARDMIDEAARTVQLAFSSETPVERWWGTEILDHSPRSVRLDRLKDGGPVLVDHDTRDHVGTIEQASVDSDRTGRAVVRFGKSGRADEVFRDIVDGIRKHVSVGYRIHKVEVDEPDSKNPTYRAVDWEPLEISLVSVPADATVGVGRGTAADERPIEIINHERTDMNTQVTPAPAAAPAAAPAVDNTQALQGARAEGQQSELKRVNELITLGEQYATRGGVELASKAIRENKDVNWFSKELLRKMSSDPLPADPQIGLSDKEVRNYSMCRAIAAMISGKWDHAGFERECHQAVEKRLGNAAHDGFYVPWDVQARYTLQVSARELVRQDPNIVRELLKRDLTAGTANAGGYLVATDNLAASFIDLLRARAKIVQLGAYMLPGLVGNVTIPKLTAASTMYWLSTEATAITESQPTFGQLALTPKNAGVYVELSRQLLLQSSPAADMLVMDDIAKVIALGVDAAAINGSGAAGQPTGVVNTGGIGSVTGTSLNWAGIVEFETDVASANADVATMAYLTTPAVRGLLKSRDKTGTTVGNYVWGGVNGESSMNGYRAEVSTQVPAANMLFGDFSNIVIPEWGTLEIAPNPYANFPAGIVGIRGFKTLDIGVRQAGAFSLATSIT